MKVVEINSVNHGSTGTIMRNIALKAKESGIDTTICFQKARSTENESYGKVIRIGNRLDRNIHLRMGKLTGMYGTYSKAITKKFVSELDRIEPDVIHLHNLHKGFINIEVLFNYIKANHIPVIWTLHDCWSFTGQCPHFISVGCDRWKIGCGNCPQYKEYPALIDRTREMFAYKKANFLGVERLVLVAPSQWLANLAQESFLKEYPVKVINNGVDLSKFYPRKSDIRNKIQAGNRTIVLGVASIWNKRKGLQDFFDLYQSLPKDKYKIVLIGLSDYQIAKLPKGILGIKRTNNVNELAEYYSAADVFFNPTKEDNFPTVNIEALACGTPIFTYDTGGSAECLINDKCGKVVTRENMIDSLHQFATDDDSRIERVSIAKRFDARLKYKEYIELYENITFNL